MQQILCVAFSQTHEWDSQNVISTGSTDGVVRMWSMDYVQVPAEDEETQEVPIANERKKEPSVEEDRNESTKKRVHELVKQMSISAEGSAMLAKSGSESSLSESENAKEASRLHEEKEECSDNDESSNGSGNRNCLRTGQSPIVVLRRKSRGNPMFRKSEGGGRTDSERTQTR